MANLPQLENTMERIRSQRGEIIAILSSRTGLSKAHLKRNWYFWEGTYIVERIKFALAIEALKETLKQTWLGKTLLRAFEFFILN